MIKKNFQVNNINIKKENFFLFYGVNEGAKQEKVNQLLNNIKKENIFNYDEKQILENEESFFEEIFSYSLFEDEKYINILRASDKILKIIRIILDKETKGIVIIINSGALDKKSKLRDFFEKEKKLICIPFYQDTYQSLNDLSLKFVRDNKISISKSNLNIIISRCNGDRGILKNELDKIKFFSISKKELNTENILKITNLSENHNITELVNHCFAKNEKQALNIINENIYNSDDCFLLLRSLLIKAKGLIILCYKFKETKNMELTLKNAKPPIFWKEKDIVKQQILKWSPDTLKELVYKLSELELLIKKNIGNSINLMNDFIINQSRSNTNN